MEILIITEWGKYPLANIYIYKYTEFFKNSSKLSTQCLFNEYDTIQELYIIKIYIHKTTMLEFIHKPFSPITKK